MSQQVKVSRDLVFKGAADHSNNIKGKPCNDKFVKVWHFEGKIIDVVNDWTLTAENSATATTNRPHNLNLLAKNQVDDDIEMASDLMYYAKYNPCLEFRVRVNNVDAIHWCCGFNDAQSESANQLAVDVIANGDIENRATDVMGFTFDNDQTPANINGVSVNSGGDGATLDTDHTEANGSWAVCRIEMVDNGTIPTGLFYFNSSGQYIDPAVDLIGVEVNVVNRANALCIYMGALARTATSVDVEIDYIKVWTDLTTTET